MRMAEVGSDRAGEPSITVTAGPVRDIQVTRPSSHRTEPNGTNAVEHASIDDDASKRMNAPTPVVLLHGDFLDCDDRSRANAAGWQAAIVALREAVFRNRA